MILGDCLDCGPPPTHANVSLIRSTLPWHPRPTPSRSTRSVSVRPTRLPDLSDALSTTGRSLTLFAIEHSSLKARSSSLKAFNSKSGSREKYLKPKFIAPELLRPVSLQVAALLTSKCNRTVPFREGIVSLLRLYEDSCPWKDAFRL